MQVTLLLMKAAPAVTTAVRSVGTRAAPSGEASVASSNGPHRAPKQGKAQPNGAKTASTRGHDDTPIYGKKVVVAL